MSTDQWCGYSAPFLGRCCCGDPANHEPGGRYYKEGRLPDPTPPRPESRDTAEKGSRMSSTPSHSHVMPHRTPTPPPQSGTVQMPLTLDRVQVIVEHLLNDGTREGLILGDELNRAMGASARRRATGGW